VAKALVFSASGSVGFELCKILLSKGIPCRAAVREGTTHTDRVVELQKMTDFNENKLFEIVYVDWNEPRTIQQALDGCDRVFLKCPLGLYESATRTFVKSIPEKTTVDWVVYFSFYDDPIKGKKTVLGEDFEKGEQVLNSIATPYCIVRPSVLFSNFTFDSKEVVLRGVIPRPLGNARINIVSDFDVADAIHHALCENQAVYNGNTYLLFGKECVDMHYFAATLSSMLHKQIVYQDVSEEEFRIYLEHHGMTKEGIPHYLKLMECAKGGGYTHTESHIPRLCDRPPRSVQECIQESITREH